MKLLLLFLALRSRRRSLRGGRVKAPDHALGRLDAGLGKLIVLVRGLERVNPGESLLLVAGLDETARRAELGGERQIVLRTRLGERIERLRGLVKLPERLEALRLADDRNVRKTVRRIADQGLVLRERLLVAPGVIVALREAQLERAISELKALIN